MRADQDAVSGALAAEDPVRGVLTDLGLSRADDGTWSGDAFVEIGTGSLRFDEAVEGSSGLGLFAKAHVDLLDAGTVVGHLKVARTGYAADAVVHEAKVLEALQGAIGSGRTPLGSQVRRTAGATWSIQEHVHGRGGWLYPSALLSLTGSIAESAVPRPPYPTPGALALAASGSSSMACACHGDLIAGNILLPPGHHGAESAAVLDWEWAGPNALPGFDISHYFLGGVLSAVGPEPVREFARLSGARFCLRRAGLDVERCLAGYLSGMADFYGWCAAQEGAVAADQPVCANASRLMGRLTEDVRA